MLHNIQKLWFQLNVKNNTKNISEEVRCAKMETEGGVPSPGHIWPQNGWAKWSPEVVYTQQIQQKRLDSVMDSTGGHILKAPASWLVQNENSEWSTALTNLTKQCLQDKYLVCIMSLDSLPLSRVAAATLRVCRVSPDVGKEGGKDGCGGCLLLTHLFLCSLRESE